MEYKELKTKQPAELHRLLSEYRNQLREARFKDASRQLKDVREIRELKIAIAQMLTILNKNKAKK